MKQATSNIPVQPMRILKTASCLTCSGKASLTYHLGCTPNSEIHFRVIANTGGGYFSPEWISLKAIQQALDKGPKPITSYVLYPLFHGKSVNTPAFLLAALRSEGLLKTLEGKQRGYECIDPANFITEINKLIASTVNLKVEEIAVSQKTIATPKSKKPKQVSSESL